MDFVYFRTAQTFIAKYAPCHVQFLVANIKKLNKSFHTKVGKFGGEGGTSSPDPSYFLFVPDFWTHCEKLAIVIILIRFFSHPHWWITLLISPNLIKLLYLLTIMMQIIIVSKLRDYWGIIIWRAMIYQLYKFYLNKQEKHAWFLLIYNSKEISTDVCEEQS